MHCSGFRIEYIELSRRHENSGEQKSSRHNTSLQTKTEMLDNLLEIEIAYSMLKSGDESSAKDPIDVHYEKLKTKMEVKWS